MRGKRLFSCSFMVGSMRRAIVCTVAGVLFFSVFLPCAVEFCSAAPGEGPAAEPFDFVNSGVTAATNIHFDKKYCTECHTDILKGGKKAPLRFKDFAISCRCHGYTSDTYRHPVNITLSPEKQNKIPEQFPLADGKMTCATCHDFRLQCLVDKEENAGNTSFLRSGDLQSRTGLCYQCHDEKKSPRIDPHNQLDDNGIIIKEKCLYCHVSIPDAAHGRLRKKDWGDEAVRLIGNLDVLCYRCHSTQAKVHPINADHYRKPSPKMLRNMQLSEQEFGIILPLDDNGKITCATCHNPHERGVIPEKRSGSAGAGGKNRLRLQAELSTICLACHRGK